MATRSNIIAVKHNIEVAHRLFELPGKCEQIHGHSMWITMRLKGQLNDSGIMGGIEFGDLKRLFRGYLDETFDHRLLLNASDPFARPLYQAFPEEQDPLKKLLGPQVFLPGLQATSGDPTTENIAMWVANEMRYQLKGQGIEEITVEVWETSVNMAEHTIWGTDES